MPSPENPLLAALRKEQRGNAALRAENHSLRYQLHRAAEREEYDLALINRLAGQLAQLDQPLSA